MPRSIRVRFPFYCTVFAAFAFVMIALPNVGRISGCGCGHGESKNRRNAQQLSSVCNASQAAGYDFVAQGGGDLEQVIGGIVTGATITDPASPFVGIFFGVPNLTRNEQIAALEFLHLERGMLIYSDGYDRAKLARMIVLVSEAARIAGHDFVLSSGDDLATALADIATGVKIEEPGNPYDGMVFSVPGLNAGKQRAMTKYLRIKGGNLVFNDPHGRSS